MPTHNNAPISIVVEITASKPKRGEGSVPALRGSAARTEAP